MFQVNMASQVNDYFAPIVVGSLDNTSMVPNPAGNYFLFFGEFAREIIIAPPQTSPTLVAEPITQGQVAEVLMAQPTNPQPVAYEQVAEIIEEEEDLLIITPQGLANNILAGPSKSPRHRNRRTGMPRHPPAITRMDRANVPISNSFSALSPMIERVNLKRAHPVGPLPKPPQNSSKNSERPMSGSKRAKRKPRQQPFSNDSGRPFQNRKMEMELLKVTIYADPTNSATTHRTVERPPQRPRFPQHTRQVARASFSPNNNPTSVHERLGPKGKTPRGPNKKARPFSQSVQEIRRRRIQRADTREQIFTVYTISAESNDEKSDEPGEDHSVKKIHMTKKEVRTRTKTAKSKLKVGQGSRVNDEGLETNTLAMNNLSMKTKLNVLEC